MINNVTKTTYEKFAIYANFSHVISADDSILSQTLACVNTLTGVDTKTIIIDSHTISSNCILIIIKAGAEGELHHITSEIITKFGVKAECDVFLSIKNSVVGSFRKQPSEEFNIFFDFENRIGSSETIASKTIVATKISDGSDATSSVITGSAIDNNTVIVAIKAGISGEFYLISSKVITDVNSYQVENIVRMDVIER